MELPVTALRDLAYGVDFKGLFASLPAPIALVRMRPDGPAVAEVSEAFLASLGLTRAGVVGRRLEDMFRTEQSFRLAAAVRRCLMTGCPTRARITHRLGGDLVRRDLAVTPILNGALQHYVLMSVEAPTRVLAISEDRQNLLDQLGPLSSSMIYVYDLIRKRTRYIHKELTTLLGLSSVGVDLNEIRGRMHPDDLPLFRDHLAELRGLRDHEVSGVTVRLKGQSGGWLWIHQRARVFSRGADGQARRVLGAATDVTHHRALTQALEDASKSLANAEAAERRRIGRELHDSTAQHLVAIDLSLGALERRNLFGERDRPLLRDIRTSLDAAQREIRASSYMLHPPSLEERGLPETLKSFAAGFGRRASLGIMVSVDGSTRALSVPVELALFRIAQEALMNIHRHAAASSAQVRLDYGTDRITLEVEDDGRGLSSTDIADLVDEETGVGVSGMRARMFQLGGELTLEPGAVGLRVRAQIPLQPGPRE